MSAKRFFKGRGRAWSHKSVLALMDLASPGEEPEDVVTRLARECVAEAVACGWSGPPFDPEALASTRGIKVEAATSDIRADARIFPDAAGKLRVEYDPKKPKARVSFSICHEISHTFFPDSYETVRHRRTKGISQIEDFELELLCDLGAAELLMPHKIFAEDLAQHGTSLRAVKKLRTRYSASSEAVLMRVAQMSSSPCAVVFLSKKFKPAEKRASETVEFELGLPPVATKLRVDYVRPSASFPVFIPQDKSLPNTSVAYECLETSDIVEGIEQWDITGFGNWNVQATELPKFEGGSQRVAALVSVQ